MLYEISEYRNVNDTTPKTKKYTWEKLKRKFLKALVTSETLENYFRMNRDERLRIKDIGGFVGGRFNKGRKKAGLKNRSLLTFDLDDAPADFISYCLKHLPFEWLIYSTHSHTPKNPRYRLVVPLSSPVVSAELYREIAKAFVKTYLDPAWVDECSYKPAQLMFWPSVSSNGVYDSGFSNNPAFFDPDSLDIDLESVLPSLNNVQDPLQKSGTIGDFNNAYYPIQLAFDELLDGIYEATDQPGRYTFKEGQSSKGVVIYNDGKTAFSFHDTDPAGDGHVKNAYDLVCIHLFKGDEKAMNHFANQDPRVARYRAEQLRSEFDAIEDDEDWLTKLEFHEKTGDILPTIKNFELIFSHDERLKGLGGYNLFSWRHEKTADLPWWEYDKGKPEWTDADESALDGYLEENYKGLYSERKRTKALSNVIRRRSFHPLRDRIKALEWDGVPRIESFLHDFFGAEISDYTNAISRKLFVAGIARLFNPGCKFDYVVVLNGTQGIGKSFTIARLAYDQYSNDLATFKDKAAVEAILGSWLIEIGEMTAHRKAEADEIKQFITRTHDKLRMAYAKNIENYPRQCIFIGSVNDRMFLKDQTGNRRFWVVDCNEKAREYVPMEALTLDVVDQLWAEAYQLFLKGEKLYLDEKLEEQAREIQQEHMLISDEELRIEDFLNSKIWEGYYKLSPEERQFYDGERALERTFTCAAEIWEVGLGRSRDKMTRADQIRIGQIVEKLGWTHLKNPKYLGDDHYKKQRYFRKNTEPEWLL